MDATPSPNQRSNQLRDLSTQETRALSHRLTSTEMERLLTSVSPGAAAKAALRLDQAALVDILAAFTPYEATDLIRVVGRSEQPLLLEALDPTKRYAVESLLQWDADSAGGNMTPSFLVLPAETTAGEALAALQHSAKQVETASYVYLVDSDGELCGAVSFRGIVTAPTDAPLVRFSRSTIRTVEPTTDREDAARILHENDLNALPVVQDGRPIGVITADRAAEIMDTETTEDFRRMGSAGGFTRSLKDASVWVLYRSHVVWLVVLVFGNVFSGAGIAHYEELIESVVALVFFLPLLIDSGGNAGAQAATLMVRGLATGEVVLRDWLKILGKEIVVAALLGVSMEVAVSILGIIRGGPEIALVVSLTMSIVVIIGCVIGMSLLFLLSKLRLDPASASAPLITSICDGVGELVYFYIASQILP